MIYYILLNKMSDVKAKHICDKPVVKIQSDMAEVLKDIKLLRQELSYIKNKLNDVIEDKPVIIKQKTETQVATEKGWFF